MSIAASQSASEALLRARNAVQKGDAAGARAILEAARRSHPAAAALAHAAGDLALKAGDAAAAAAHFSDACQADPNNIDYVLDHAIALQRMGRHREALSVLSPREQAGRDIARYGRVRALSERSLGNASQAATWYDAAIAADPRHPRALHGRARVALERGERDAVARFDAALAVNPGDADLWLGKAQALEVAGDVAGARTIAEQLCAQAPTFIPALTFLAGLNLAAGEADFTAPFAEAAARVPQDPNIPASHAEVLAGLDYSSEAAEIAAAARKRFPDEAHFALLEAVYAGAAGDWNRAEAIFDELAVQSPTRWLHEARHRIRAGDTACADGLIERALGATPWDVSAWALRGIVWRLAGDDRAEWLHEQTGLVQVQPLVARENLLDDVVALLRDLHAGSSMPLGQSLRGGTQTRGILFQRTEPLLAELREAILATLENYRAQLPSKDDAHPLLRHRDTALGLAGSWSVRLTAGSGGTGDYHASHIHPQGILSSALYLVVPEQAHGPERLGWLEVGRPPADLGLELEPLQVIEPQPGHLALFPSTMYHGTTPFGRGSGECAERMTVAFDVVPSE